MICEKCNNDVCTCRICKNCGKQGLWSIFKIDKDGGNTGFYFHSIECVYEDMGR